MKTNQSKTGSHRSDVPDPGGPPRFIVPLLGAARSFARLSRRFVVPTFLAGMAGFTFAADTDGDGVDDALDADIDNDGILNAVESPSCYYSQAEMSAPSATASTLAWNSSYGYERASDGNTATYTQLSSSGQSITNQVLLELTPKFSPQKITSLDLSMGGYAISSSASSGAYKLQGYDGASWVDLSSSLISTTINGTVTFGNTLQPGTAYQKFRIFGVSGTSGYSRINEAALTLASGYIASLNPKSSCGKDTDGDGVLDINDLDSDNDGTPDSREASPAFTAAQVDAQGRVTGSVSVNGVPIAAGSGSAIGYSQNDFFNTLADTDGDGILDLVDADIDNDGILNATEAPGCYYSASEAAVATVTGSDLVWRAGNPATYAADGDTSTYSFLASTGQAVTGKVLVEITPQISPLPVTSVSLSIGNWAISSSSTSGAYKLQGFDGASWVDLSSQLISNSYNVTVTFNNTLQPSTAYQKFRIAGVSGNAGYAEIKEITLTAGSGYVASLHPKDDCGQDSDADGVLDIQDLDSDLDGVFDALEASPAFTAAQIDSQGRVTGGVDANGVPTVAGSSGRAVGFALDTDNDGVQNLLDADADNDGILNMNECQFTAEDSVNFSISGGVEQTFQVNGRPGGWVIDIDDIDNAIDIVIDGARIGNIEVQFGTGNTGSNAPNVRWADGTDYQTYGSVWTVGAANAAYPPLIRFVIDASGNVSLFGRKAAGGPLLPMEAFNGLVFNKMPGFSGNSVSSIWMDQSTVSQTFAKGRLSLLAASGSCDTDGDGTPDYLDTDSDGDGCSDAIEGSASFTSANLDVNGRLTGGVGTATGIPTVAGSGQTVGSARNPAVRDSSCPTSPCTTPSALAISPVSPSAISSGGMTSYSVTGGTVNGGTTAYTWAITPSGGVNPASGTGTSTGSITFANSGTYTVTFTASNSTVPSGCGPAGTSTASVTQTVNLPDLDGDGVPDIADEDSDNDGIPNAVESPNCYYTQAEMSAPTATGSTMTFYAGFPLANATDGNTTTYSSLSASGLAIANQVLIELTPKYGSQKITSVDLSMGGYALSSSATSGAYKLQGYNGAGWVDLSASVTSTAVNTVVSFSNTLQPGNAYQKFRIYGVSGNAAYAGIKEVALTLASGYNASLNPKASCTADKDGDGIANQFDNDSDGDGCFDAIEGGGPFTAANVDSSGRLTGGVGSNGIPTVAGSGQTMGASQDTAIETCTDTDGDGIFDSVDLDDDNDGILDVYETCSGAFREWTFNDGAQGWTEDDSGTIQTLYTPSTICSATASLIPAGGSGDYVAGYDNLAQSTFAVSPNNLNLSLAGLTNPRLRWKWMGGFVGGGTQTLTYAIKVKLVSGTTTLTGQMPTTVTYGAYQWIDFSIPLTSGVFGSGITSVLNDLDQVQIEVELFTGGTENADCVNTQEFYALDNVKITGDCSIASEDIDGDGIPNSKDLDSDGDGCPDAIEGSGSLTAANLDANGRLTGGVDSFGIPVSAGTNGQTAGDSQNASASTQCPVVDTDGDGLSDAVDLDDDNDGIPDTVEAATALNGGDTDGDGIPDIHDLDSDGDGIPDFVEARNLTPAQIAALDANHDGRLDGASGTDGIPDVVQTSPNAGTVNYTPLDTDGDGRPDFQDLDSDNDGINDVREANGTDANGDGKADGTTGTNGIASGVPAGGLIPVDTDSDGKPDFRDLDADNDGINDVVENGGSDPDNNGIVGTGQTPTDTDGDGIPDAADGSPNAYGDSGDTTPRNSDNDTIPDYRDLDSDNDTIADVIEGGNGPSDTNGDGTISPTESGDTDGDGIPNIVDNNPGTFGDAGNPALPNTDGTDTPDYIDVDSDNDGTKDICELTIHCALDGNGDGMVDNPIDPDGDGIPNNGGNDTVPGGFGGATVPTTPLDSDGDGIADSIDLDDDNDGIPDTVEAATAINGGDTDGDGIPDTLDLDSDGDGILDFVEARNLTSAQIAALDANHDGRLDGAVGTDGIPDVVQTTPNAGTVNYTPVDSDGDSRPDFQDLDSDNDGINDVREANGTDANGDGKADGTTGTTGIASGVPAGGLIPVDTDGDGKPDFRDLDSDNDGVNDVVEAGLPDPDNNGIAGTGQTPTDTDHDGIVDVVDGAPSAFGDSGDPTPRNSDNDTIPDYRDLDSDNDTIADVIEGGNGPSDTNGDGTISPTESGDSDGDGIPNIVDNNPGTFGDAGNPALPNTDGTDNPDYIDVDSDNDGTKDICELTTHCALDGNGDGMVDSPTDPDGDGIPNNGGNDTIPNGFGGSTVPNTPLDSDGDGIPDATDLDDDNDGIPDTVEIANAINGGDTDGDGIKDELDLDSDNDGILDFVEARSLTPAQIASLDANHDGRLDGAVGTDGIPDVVQATPNAGTVTYTVLDFDGDGRPDYVDLDSDDDGINDVREANGTDANGDGKADGTVGTSGIAATVPAGGLVPVDTDSDGRPDFRDLDADNDGISDVRENGGTDSNNDGIADGTDADGDGIRSSADGSPTWGDSGDQTPRNSDNDTVPNYRDLDSDNDTIADVIEGGYGDKDTNNDGFLSPLDTNGGDTDGDGIADSVDESPATYGDAGGPVPPEQGGADTDTIPDYLDVDSDGDGLFDIQESTGNAVYDANHDGMVDDPQDTEQDGIANIGGIDGAPGAYGDLRAPDTDGDGIPDSVDLDDDNDGIPDTVEIATAANGGDTDGDGILDYKDLDSDNDGILDMYESGQTTGVDLNGDGRLDGPVGTDGIPNSVQSSPNAGTVNYTVVDFDGDGRPDFQDLDSDNDGINDVRESNGTDANGDGKADGPVSPEGIPGTVPTGGAPRVDTDGDGHPDFRDLDSDNDGVNDVVENGGVDSDNNGIADGTDTDGDGIPSSADGSPGTWGDSNDPAPVNSDNDTVPNYRDLDSDNDAIGDVIEGGNGPADTNNDGFISPLDTNGGDTDGDGIPNSLDNSPTFGDAGNPALPEGPDADTIPDYIDVDSDGDGINDICESTQYCAQDGNGDGMVDNPVDPDGDGIPNNGGIDGAPSGFGGLPAPTVQGDNDGDGIPDDIDLDDDNDGIPDTVEIANALNGGDTDGDGIPDIHDLDSDNDGIFDVVEAGHAGLDANKDGRIDTPVGSNGLADVVETTPGSGVINYVPRDTDGDGRPDYVDLDSDNDTISDLIESGNPALGDADHDGLVDGTPNASGVIPGTGQTTPVDTDGDGTPDYRDVDRNNDGIPDIRDNGFGGLDSNNDGKVDNAADPDGDGIPNVIDTEPSGFGGFPAAGCVEWSMANAADNDGDVFPSNQEYAFGGSPAKGDHKVVGTTRRQGLVIAKNATGGVDASFVRPQGRFDVTYTLQLSADLQSWTDVSTAPVAASNGDTTETLIWANAQGIAPATTNRGFARMKVTTPCDGTTYTLVQGWCRETVAGKQQTYGVNFTSLPVFTGMVDSASGSTLTIPTSGGGLDLGSFLTSPGTYYIEFTDGTAEGHRIDLTSGAVDSLSLNLASANNTTSALPSGLAGSHFVIRKHRTLGEIFVNTEWNSSSAVGTSDQVLFYNGTGYDTYYNLPNGVWVKQGGGFASQNNKVIPPGEGVMVVHADPNDTNTLLQIGDVRYNDFIRPLKLGTTGLNLTANGYPLDASPASLGMSVPNGFIAGATVGSATQILNWTGDTTVNATGWVTNFQLASGNWRTQGNLGNATANSMLFKHCRATFVDVLADVPNWKHAQPWAETPWIQR